MFSLQKQSDPAARIQSRVHVFIYEILSSGRYERAWKIGEIGHERLEQPFFDP